MVLNIVLFVLFTKNELDRKFWKNIFALSLIKIVYLCFTYAAGQRVII